MVDCIVFPQLGFRPHPDEMSGSDLDGDEYFVCWDKRFHGIENQDPMDFPKAEKKNSTSYVQLTDMVDFLATYIKNDNLGIIANAHLAMADSEPKGIFSDFCLELARKHSNAVDFPKTGNFAQIDTDIRPQKYPDFMMKRDKLSYFSSKILGILYRQCLHLHNVTQRENLLGLDIDIDEDFVSKLTRNEAEDGNIRREVYNNKLIDIMNEYGLQNENEAVSGIIQTLRSKKSFVKGEKIQIGKRVREKVSVLLKGTRASFFEEFGGEDKKHTLLEPMIRKASVWYTVTYKNQNRSNAYGHLLSFPWVVADILSMMKHKKIQTSSLDRIEISLEKRIKRSEKDRREGLKCLQSLRLLIEQTRPQNLYLEWIALSGNDIVLPGDYIQYLYVKREDIKPLISTIQRFPNPVIPKEIDSLSEKLCFSFKLEDGMHGSIILITDGTIANKSKVINQKLDNSCLTSVIQFLLEEIRDSSTFNNPADAVEHMLPLLLVQQSTVGKMVRRIKGKASVLIDCLKNARLYLKNILAFADLPLCSLHWLMNNTEKIVKRYLVKYMEISFSLSVDTPRCEEKEQIFQSESMLLPIDSWNAVEFAIPYVEFKLKEKTGADIFIYHVELRKSKALKLEARGTSLQLETIHQALYDMSTNSIAKSITYEKFGQTKVDEALTVLFEGSTQNDDIVKFQIYHGLCQKHHMVKPKYLPYLEYYYGTDYGNGFQEAFYTQWRKIQNEYRDIFHGDLNISLVFGAFYVMDKKENKLTVSKLNDYLRKFEERRIHGYKMGCVPYSFSFLPMHKQTENLVKVLETHFVKVDTQRTVKVRVGNQGLLDLDEDLNIIRYNAPEIKWFIGQIIRLPSQNRSNADNIGARCKILSYRNLTKDVVMRLEENNWPQHDETPLIQRSGGDFSACSDRVTYIREKETAIYSNKDLNMENKVWRTMQVEVSKVKEYDVDQQTSRCKNISERTELAIIPFIPDLRSPAEEIYKYSKQLWEIALYFGKTFDS